MENNLPKNIPPAKKPPHPDFGRYTDPEGDLPTGRFKFELWLVKNKLRIYQVGVWSLAIFSALTIIYSVWQFGDYLIFGIDEQARIDRELTQSVNYSALHGARAPSPIEIVNAGAILGRAKIDLYAILANHNDNFIVAFDYFFVVNGQATPRRRATLLAGESRPVAELGYESESGQTVEVVLQDLAWTRVDKHRISDAILYQQNHLAFGVASSSILSPMGPDDPSGTVISFDISNDTPYSYRDANFLVGVYQGSSLYALLPLLIKDFETRTTRSVDLRSYSLGSIGSEVRVYPMINIYDSGVYLSPPQ